MQFGMTKILHFTEIFAENLIMKDLIFTLSLHFDKYLDKVYGNNCDLRQTFNQLRKKANIFSFVLSTKLLSEKCKMNL